MELTFVEGLFYLLGTKHIKRRQDPSLYLWKYIGHNNIPILPAVPLKVHKSQRLPHPTSRHSTSGRESHWGGFS
jgi:hypothetical protein